MLNPVNYQTESGIPMHSRISTITKKLLTLILIVSGIFSYSIADAQCICYCNSNNQPKNFSECYTRPNGTLGCRPSRCRGGVANDQITETVSLLLNPNPESNSTTVSFYVEESENVSIKVFDISGKLVAILADASFDEGGYEVTWDATEVNSGVYFLRFETPSLLEDRKLIVAK